MSEKRDFQQSKPTPLFPIDGDESLFPDTAPLPPPRRQPDRLHRRDARADEYPRCAGADGAYDHAVPALRHAGSPKVSATA